MPIKKLSIELVPSPQQLTQQAAYLAQEFNSVGLINIPDLPRFALRSWVACSRIQPWYGRSIPHLRAGDFSLSGTPEFMSWLREQESPSVLIVSGDPPENFSTPWHQTTIFDLLRYVRKMVPRCKIYGALDPYRQSLDEEARYLERKLEAGFHGFFTQPFFSLDLLRVYQDLLQGTEVFWGLSPVVSERSMGYWCSRNKVRFPTTFRPTLDWSLGFGADFLHEVGAHDGNFYIMPIRVPLEEYLPPLLGQ